MKRGKDSLWLLLIIVTLLAAISPPAFADQIGLTDVSSERVRTVDVQVSFPTGLDVENEIEKRMEKSISRVATNLLVGQKIETVEKTQTQLSNLIKKVFEEVLGGYQAQKVGLLVGENTIVILDLEPTGQVIKDVEMNLQIHGVNDKIKQLVNLQLQQVTQQGKKYLLGLPVASLSWASGIVDTLLTQLILWQIPGFEPRVEIQMEETLQVSLELIPRGQRIEEVQVDLSSHSMPHLMTKMLEERLERELAIFQGIPIKLLEKYQYHLVEEMERVVDQQGSKPYIYLSKPPQIEIGPVTKVGIQLDWIDYQVDLVANLQLGLEKFRPSLQLSLGKDLTPQTIFFLRDRVSLNPLKNSVSVGLEHNFGAGFSTQIDYRFLEAAIDAQLDWRGEKFGLTFAQSYPGISEGRNLAFNYYPGPTTQLSINTGEKGMWLSLEQIL